MSHNKKTITISTHLNNCAFHSITPFILKLLKVDAVKGSGFSFNEFQPLSSDVNSFQKTKGYEYFKKAFAQYFYLDETDNIEEKIQWLLKNHSHPLDAQVLLGSILRLTLKSVLLNSTDHEAMIRDSFVVLLDKCKGRFDTDVPSRFKQNPLHVNQWLSELKLETRDEFDELYYPNLDIIAQFLLTGDALNKEQFLKANCKKAYERYVENQCDINRQEFVSKEQLEMLCHSFQFNLGVDGYQNLLPESELPFKPLANIELSNITRTHWEIVSRKDSEWGFDKTSEKLPTRLAHYHSQLQSLSSSGARPEQIEVLQNTFRDELHQSILNKKAYEQSVYTVVPSEDWSQNGGLEDFVGLIARAVNNKSTIPAVNKDGVQATFQSTLGFRDFLEHFRRYYAFDEALSHKQITEKISWLLKSYPHPQEQFMIITPVLRSMLNDSSLIPSVLNINEIVALCHKFELGLNVYHSQKDEAKITCFYKIYSHKPKDVTFGTIEISTLERRFNPVRRHALEGFKETAIHLGSKQHAFMQSASAARGLRSRVRELQVALRKTCQTGVLHIERPTNISALIGAPKTTQRTVSSPESSAKQPATLRTLLAGNDSQTLVSFIEEHNIDVNKALLGKAPRLSRSSKEKTSSWMPLHIAVCSNQIGSVKALVELGASCTIKAPWFADDNHLQHKSKFTKRDISPLELAALLGQRDTVSFMLGTIKPEEHKALVQSAYNVACDFGHAGVLYAFLPRPEIKHQTKALETALSHQDLFLLSSLLKLGAPFPRRYQYPDNILLKSFNTIKDNASDQNIIYSTALHNVLMMALHEKNKNQYNEITSGLKLWKQSGQLVDIAVKKGLSKWVNTIAKYQESIGVLLQLGDASNKIIHQNINIILEPIAQNACLAITDKNSELLNHCLSSEGRCLVFPGKLNPMHHALACENYRFLQEAYFKYGQSNGATKDKAFLGLNKIGENAYDEYDRSFSFRLERSKYKKELDEKLSNAGWVETPLIYGQKAAFTLNEGRISIVDSFHLKAKHNAVLYNNPILKYGSPLLQILPHVGMIAAEGPLRFGCELGKIAAYRYFPTLVQYTTGSYTSDNIKTAGSIIGHGVSFALMPQYYALSTIASTGVYYGCKYSGLDKFESIEALTQLCADQICYRYSLGNAKETVFDDRYFMRLDRNLSACFGESATQWLSPAVYGLDYANAQLDQIAAKPLEVIKPYFSASTFASIQENLNLAEIKPDDLPFNEQLSSATQYAQTAQGYVKSYYQKRQMWEEWAFNHLEGSILEKMGDSTFKAERLHAIQASRSNILSYDIYNLEQDIKWYEEGLESAEKDLEVAISNLDAYTPTALSALTDRAQEKNLESSVWRAQVKCTFWRSMAESYQASLETKQATLIESKERQEALFKETQGYSYFEDWQEKALTAKQAEYDKNFSGEKKDTLRQAEQEALSKSRLFNTDATNKEAELWVAGVNVLFDKHKDNFLDTTNIPNTMQGIINYVFDNMRGQPNDRNDMAEYFAGEIIRYKYPFYPEIGDKSSIEAERDVHFKEITNSKMEQYNKSGDKLDKCKRNVEDYITSEILGISIKKLQEQGVAYAHKDRKYSFWEHLIMAPANEILGKIFGYVPFPYYTGNGTPPGGGKKGNWGIQFSTGGPGSGYNLQFTINNQPLFTIYDSTNQKQGQALSLPKKAELTGQSQDIFPALEEPAVVSQREPQVTVPEAESILPGLSYENPYVQAALAEQREAMFSSKAEDELKSDGKKDKENTEKGTNPVVTKDQAEVNIKLLTQISYGFRHLRGDKSPEILDWQRKNREGTSSSTIATVEGIKAPVGPALILAAKDLVGAIDTIFNLAKSCMQQSEELAGSNFALLGPGIAVGCSMKSIKATKVLGAFIGEEAARIALDEKLESTKFLRDKTNEFIASYEKMDSYERSREILRFIFSIGLAGPAFKASTQAVKAGGNAIAKTGEAVSKLPALRRPTLTKRPVMPVHETVAEPLINKYAELVATKAPETGRTLRASTLAQRKSTSFTPNHSAIAKSNKHNINAQWFDDVSSYFTPIKKLTIPAEPAKSFMAGKYSSYILKEDTAFWRAGNATRGFGEFYSNFKPMSEIQSRIDSAVLPIWDTGRGSVLEAAYCVKIPKGTVVHIGETAPKGGVMLGGTQQVYIEASWEIKGAEIIQSQVLEEGMIWNQKARKAKI
tara:strand:+ start:20818 stop:27372 length:6555 start_codon:yes stop_codon:yes gene_type:complete